MLERGVPMTTRMAMGSMGRGRTATDADVSILRSKITMPGRPDWAVPRPRLDRLIADGVRGPLTALMGPPGMGKTLAMALWAAGNESSSPVAWVTLDEFDNRPRVLWSYVMAALRRAGVAVPDASWSAACVDTMDHEFLVRLAAALAAAEPPVILVLDDLHLLTERPALQGLIYLMRNAAEGLRVVVASRIDPLLPLHRFRLTGELTEIRADQLEFSVPEAGLLMAQHDVALPQDALECLTERAEGWAAGLRLAAISMHGHPDPEQFVKEFVAEDSPVVGYLVDEVLNAQPPGIRDLLLRTSILGSFDTGIASELSDGHGENDVSDLVRANAFVLPAGSGWYRYHALFADVLRLKLRHESPDLVPELHRRAAGWYRRNGLLTEAVRHAAAAGDWPLAARIVVGELAVGQLIQPQGNHSLADEFARMPAQGWTRPEPLLVAAALALAEDEPGSSWLAAAESMLGTLPPAEATPARLAAAQIRLASSRRTGDLGSMTAAAAEAQAMLAALPTGLVARCPWIGAQVLAGRGAAELWSGHLGEAAATFEAAIAAIPAAHGTHERADCRGYLALADALRGRLNRAAGTAGPASAGDGERLSAPVSPAAHVALAAVHVERNELRQAHGELKRAEAALRLHPDQLTGTVACLVAARKALAEGHPDGAVEIVRKARPGGPLPHWLERRVAMLESRACAASGDAMSALDAAGRADPASLEAAVTQAHAWLAAGDPQAARKSLAGHRERAEAVPDHVRLEAWLATARISYGSSDRAEGRRSLQRALRLGEPEQLRLPFALERTWLRRVLRADPDLAHVYRDLLEPDLVGPARGPARPPGASPAPVMLEPLSSREREVLRYAAEMLDTTEIAAVLFISVNTVKSHLKSIYRKLAVTHRGEAVRRARQLRIL
jgi:LuxR family transcriptional regulator, maltose regulon positive regulatory protein